ncbi:MAG TPA: hypothetical protein VG826_29065 [Pirellulales bacterium]|nr:hypothetical protein [Pirellulales bacterium]
MDVYKEFERRRNEAEKRQNGPVDETAVAVLVLADLVNEWLDMEFPPPGYKGGRDPKAPTCRVQRPES